jgi:hypothetical protein
VNVPQQEKYFSKGADDEAFASRETNANQTVVRGHNNLIWFPSWLATVLGRQVVIRDSNSRLSEFVAIADAQ